MVNYHLQIKTLGSFRYLNEKGIMFLYNFINYKAIRKLINPTDAQNIAVEIIYTYYHRINTLVS